MAWENDNLHKIYNPDWNHLDQLKYYLITNDFGGNNYTATEITDIYKYDFKNVTILVVDSFGVTKRFYQVSNVADEDPYPVKGILNRKNGPADIDEVGTETWYQNGELHRLNGPCIDYTKSRHMYNYPEDAVDCYEVSDSTEPYLKMFFYERYKKEIELYDESRKQINLRNGWDEAGINWLGIKQLQTA